MKVLLIEDNQLLGRSVKLGLEELGWIVDLASDGEEGLYLAQNSTYDIFLIDRMLPKLSGIDVIRKMREADINGAAIIITALGATSDKISGLEVADDYIVKPFEMGELVARMKAVYRRSIGKSNALLECGNLGINLNEQSVTINGEKLDLTAKEFDLLESLATRQNHVCSRAELSGLLYSFNGEPESNSLDVLLGRLRKKLQGASVEIVTIRSKGFMLRVE
jgi:DNA-binding response OmpR family regulator